MYIMTMAYCCFLVIRLSCYSSVGQFASYCVSILRRNDLLAILDKHCRDENMKSESFSCKSAYDFVYLPMDFMYVAPFESLLASCHPFLLVWLSAVTWSGCLFKLTGTYLAGSFGLKGRHRIWATHL